MVTELAGRQRGLMSRQQALELGMSAQSIARRAASSRWRAVHAGVYTLSPCELDWPAQLLAACLAAGPNAAASYRAANLTHGLDGLGRAPVEITVPHPEEATLRGVITHRSRRLTADDVTVVSGIPCTSVERTLCELGRFVPPITVRIAAESAFRRWKSTPTKLGIYLEERGRGLPGWREVDALLRRRPEGRPAGSPAEAVLLECLQRHGVEDPIRQFVLDLPDHTSITLDLAWPGLRFGIEWQGFEYHSDSRAFAALLERSNSAQEAGWQLRQYTGSMLNRDPKALADRILRTLGGLRAA
jgi:hypothetical protein